MDRKLIILLPFIFSIVLLILGISDNVTLSLFLMCWMVAWWIFEVLPLGITALIPMVFAPIAGLMDLKEIAINYSNPVIYLFLGGFMIARGLEKTRLSERIALQILKFTGKSDRGIVIGFILATGFLSMWISNTATTVMMVPIAISVTNFLKESLPVTSENEGIPAMEIALFLGIAYSANIGGIMTPIGTPPNVVFVGYLDELFQYKIDFFKWFLITAPTGVLVMLAMYKLTQVMFPYRVPVNLDFQDYVKRKIQVLGKVSGEQKITLFVFVFTAFLWIFKGLIHKAIGQSILSDTSIAIFGGILLFLIPKDFMVRDLFLGKAKWTSVLEVEDISKLPWNIVLLFGGGMALANILKDAGIIQMATNYFAGLNLADTYWLIFLLALLTLFLTEIMSNVALCVVALPVIMNLGVSQDIHPFVMALPATLCSSFAFSMPVSTPPNAIVFGTNRVKVVHMVKAGVILNFISAGIVMTVSWWLVKVVL